MQISDQTVHTFLSFRIPSRVSPLFGESVGSSGHADLDESINIISQVLNNEARNPHAIESTNLGPNLAALGLGSLVRSGARLTVIGITAGNEALSTIGISKFLGLHFRVLNATAGGSGGLARAAKYSKDWQVASLKDAISRHAGLNPTQWVTKKGKLIIENSANGRQLVIDIEGGYFRIFQPNQIGGKSGEYLTLSGHPVITTLRLKSGKITSIPLKGKDVARFQKNSHYVIEELVGF